MGQIQENVIQTNAGILQRLDNIKAKFDEFQCEVGELSPSWEDCKTSDGRIRRRMNKIQYAGQDYRTTPRFLNSLCSRFCFSNSIFNFFNPVEVFERLQMVEPRTKIRVVTNGQLCLAATNPEKSYIDCDTLVRLLFRCAHKIEDVNYKDGVVTTIHKMNDNWEIHGDPFAQVFSLSTPIDGYGLPGIHLGLQRAASKSYLIADNKVFKSAIKLGKETRHTSIPLMRAIETFNNEEGYQAIRQRLECARYSEASLNETNSLYNAFRRAERAETPRWQAIHENLVKLYGRVDQKYGIATMESISAKKARLLPMNCTVADLINFAIEVGSSSNVDTNREPIDQWVGKMLCNEYDLENTLDQPAKTSDNYMEDLNKVDSPFILQSV